MGKYHREELNDGKYVVFERGRDWRRPRRAITFAFDTENIVLLDGVVRSQKEIYHLLKNTSMDEKRQRLKSVVWAWQCYDEENGFFQTNDFYVWLFYQCRCKYKYGWCYNATFDFSQIDYQILSDDRWKRHERKTGEAYNRGQPWAFESIHNDTGARYAYKLWIPYRNLDGHSYTHGVEYRDFMKIMVGGLAKILRDMNVCDNAGNPIRKLKMDYQAVDINNPTDDELDYCMVDVKGLYYAIKQFNETIEQQSNGELHIFGEKTNIMTAGGFAKHELLRSIYPEYKTRKRRIKQYQRDHPITESQDKYYRKNHLYRGGISFVNPKYKGKLLRAEDMGSPMFRYDVNSEYPYAMAQIHDLVGEPVKKRWGDYAAMPDKEDYECILILTTVKGEVLDGMLPIWYDPFIRDYVSEIDEHGTHLMFKREFDEMYNWYDIWCYECEWVILYKRGEHTYKPFVEENYAVKAQAKIDKNMCLSLSTKLKLNSSYGKLSERIERIIGHYEMNEETNAVHFIIDDRETDTSGTMSVAVGALVTSYARCYILSKIREICGNRCDELFVYIDTDSIHCFQEYGGADDKKLGGLKLEAICPACKYILPKTYIDIGKIDDGIVDIDDLEIHSKGISPSVIRTTLSIIGKDGLSLSVLDNEFSYGKSFIVLCAMNVPGGKVLVPTVKDLARIELAPDESMLYINTGITGTYLTEV